MGKCRRRKADIDRLCCCNLSFYKGCRAIPLYTGRLISERDTMVLPYGSDLQVRSLRAQLEETDGQLQESERRAKAAIAQASSGVNDGGILRVEEDLFHELQTARDELSSQKAARRELEGQVRCIWCLDCRWLLAVEVGKPDTTVTTC